jgi:hypothetical protein
MMLLGSHTHYGLYGLGLCVLGYLLPGWLTYVPRGQA